MCYNCLPYLIFPNMLIVGSLSLRGNKYAQVCATSFGWTRAHPMQMKGKAHETLSTVFNRDGVPPTMIMDNSKEQVKGNFKKKLKEADCHLKQMEPYLPWKNTAEGAIRELKKGCSRQMIKTGSPEKL